MPVAGLTALHALRQGGLLLGRKVLVDGASGGWTIGTGAPGPISLRLKEELIGIQYGNRPDPFGWVYKVA